MLLDVSFPYIAYVLRGRSRTQAGAEFALDTTLNFTETTDAEAPVALRYVEFRHSPDWPNPVTAQPAVEMRLHGGRLFRPRAVYADGKTARPCDADWLRATAADPLLAHLLFDDCRHYGAKPRAGKLPVAIETDPSVRRVTMSFKGTTEAQLHTLAADTILVDGMAWVAAPEPVLHFIPGHLLVEGACKGARFTYPKNPGHDAEASGNTFRFDEAEFAESWLVETLGLKVSQKPVVEVLRPDALRHQAAEYAILHASTALVEDTEDVDAPAYAAARDALAAALDDFARAAADDAADGDALVPLVEATIDAHPRNRRPASRLALLPLQRCALAVKRYDAARREPDPSLAESLSGLLP
jgi:hypothetical protein